MRSHVASIVLAAVFVLAPAAAGYAPALSQDFSITNKVVAGGEWIGKLQAWWDVHAWYPPDALEKKEDGTVKLHLVIHENGEVWTEQLVQGSGSKSIDIAGFYAFHGAHLLPFPPGTPAPQADVFLTLHFVLAHQQSKSPFTIGNDPVQGAVVDTMLERTCTGTVEPLWGWASGRYAIVAIWCHRPDGTKWVKLYQNGTGPNYRPVTEIGKSAAFRAPPINAKASWSSYWVWPVGDNRLSGTVVDPYGTFDLTCE
jgi:hypothetical protein